MTVSFYINKSDRRYVKKNISPIATYDCILKENTTKHSPSIQVQLNNLSNIMDVNYVYIPTFKTYYYVKNPIFLHNNIIEFPLEEDVLMSNANEILQIQCVIERQQTRFNTYLDDPLYHTYNYTRKETHNFSSGFNKGNYSYIMAICGGE